MNVYVVRARPDGSDREDQFLEGTISIGWPVGRSFEGLGRNDLEQALRTAYGDDVNAVTVTTIRNFLDIGEGDLALVPSLRTRDVHLFEVVSGYRYVPDWEKKGNPHTIAVKHMLSVRREQLSSSLLNALYAARKAVTPISKHLDEVVALVNEGGSGEVRIDDASAVLLEAKSVLQALLSSEDERIRLDAAVAIFSVKW